MFSNGFEFELVKTWPSGPKTFSYKIWTCTELNEEQISPLDLFKIRNGI
jgi:hypothetical protein